MNLSKLTSLVALSLSLTACGVGDAALDGEGGVESTDDALSARGRFETFAGKDGKTYFHLLAGNGEKVLQSQGYASQQGAEGGIASVKANGTDASKFLLREASDGAWYFVVAAANGELVGVSEMYASQSNATRGMAATAAVVRATVAQGPAATGQAKFEIFKGLDSKHYFHVRALNGEIVLQSQGYTSKASAANGAAAVQLNGADATRYTVLPAADGQAYFTLKAGNGAIIARSETYASRSNAQRGVVACIELLKVELPR